MKFLMLVMLIVCTSICSINIKLKRRQSPLPLQISKRKNTMHIAITIWAVAASWRWWSWKYFYKYHATILYMSLLNLLYLFFTVGYPLWKIQPDFGLSFPATSMMYTFIIFPCTAMLFLVRYPAYFKSQVLHNAKWMIIYFGVEWVGSIINRISYGHGWNLGWSLLFVIMMFPMLRLHYKRPILAYLLSIIIILLILYKFDIPWTVPLEERLSNRSGLK